MGRISSVALALAVIGLTGCGRFGASWREFLELDGASVAPSHRAGTGRRALPIIADSVATVEQIRQIYADADSYLQGLPGLDARYTAMIEGYRKQIEKDRTDKNITDPVTLRRRMEQVAGQVSGMYDRIHSNSVSVQKSYQDRLGGLMDHAGDLEKSCNALQREPQAPADQKQACSRFQDAYSMLKAKSEMVTGSFARTEAVYSESLNTIRQLAADAIASASKPTVAAPAQTTKTKK